MHAEEANVESPRVFDASSSTNKKFRRRERNKCCMIGKLGRVSRHFTFYRLHAAYFGVLTIVGTISLWLSRKRSNISFVDCIFNAVSALTVTGLLSLRVRDFTTFGMFALMLLMLFGSHVFTSLLPLYVRRFHFFRYNTAHHAAVNGNGSNTSDNPITICKSDQVFSSDSDLELKVIKEGFTDDPPINHEDGSDYDTMSDDCVQISLEQQALMTLCWLVPLFFVGVQCLGFLIIVCYNAAAPPRIRNLYNEENINPTFFAIFSSISAFSNTGISPLDENMMPFQTSSLLVPLAVLILAGNTMFPPSMRFIIWSLYHCTRSKNPQKKVYEYLLRYPRRCYTHLFPQAQTNWLVVTVLAFNAIDFLAFCALDWKLEAVEGTHVTVGTKLMDGIFQSLNTRSAGMNVVSLRDLSPPMLVLYVGMMYIAVYPVFLSRQNTRVAPSEAMYHESDLCVFRKNWETEVEDNKLSVQYRKLLAQDSAYVFIYVFLICTIETHNIVSDSLNYSIFNIIFEVISAYGNVGLSVGYSCAQKPNGSPCVDVPYSFSGKWSAGAKLLLVAVMLLGRHRGLPDNIDSAICLNARNHQTLPSRTPSLCHHPHAAPYCELSS